MAAKVENAKVVAVVVNDPLGAMRIVDRARSLNPEVYVIARARYLQEADVFFDLGADDVIPDELGASIEVFTRVLSRYKIASEKISALIAMIRNESFGMIRPRDYTTALFSEIRETLREIGVKTLLVHKNSPFIDRALFELELRKKYGLTILVIKRGKETIYHVDPDSQLKAGDKVIVVGEKIYLEKADGVFSANPA